MQEEHEDPQRFLGSRYRRILALSIPIIAGMASQNVMNLVDTAMVGRLGAMALAATGFASFLVFLSCAFIQGIGSGVQTLSSYDFGAKKVGTLCASLNGGVGLAIGIGIPMSFFFFWLAPSVIPLVSDEKELCDLMLPYYQSRIFVLIATGINFAFRGFWNATDRPGLYLRTLVFMHICNILLNYGLIYGNWGFPELGVAGAGLASCISTYLGTLYYAWLGFRRSWSQGFARVFPPKAELRSLIHLSIPAGLQQTFLAAGLVLLFGIISMIGTVELAAANIIINISLVGILPALGLGLAAASLVGQALGKGEPDDAYRWGWDVVKVGLCMISAIAFGCLFFTDPIVSLFIQDTATIAMSSMPMKIAAISLFFDAIGAILLYALMGAGANKTTMIAMVCTQWGIGLPLSLLLGPFLGFGLIGVWIGQLVYRAILTAVLVYVWNRGSWKTIL